MKSWASGWITGRATGADDRSVFWAHLTVSLLVVLSVGYVNLVMDYARVRIVLGRGYGRDPGLPRFAGFFSRASRESHRRLCRTFLLRVGAPGSLPAGLPWEFINTTIAGGSHIREPLALAGLFVVQQVVMFGRYWFRVATWGQRVVLLLQHKTAAPRKAHGSLIH